MLLAPFFFEGYRGGAPPTGWPHTNSRAEPDCRGPEAKPHRRGTPNTPYTRRAPFCTSNPSWPGLACSLAGAIIVSHIRELAKQIHSVGAPSPCTRVALSLEAPPTPKLDCPPPPPLPCVHLAIRLELLLCRPRVSWRSRFTQWLRPLWPAAQDCHHSCWWEERECHLADCYFCGQSCSVDVPVESGQQVSEEVPHSAVAL